MNPEDTKPVEGTEEGTTPIQEGEGKPQLSADEQKALEMGWRPKEEFDGDEADFIHAHEFVRRKPLFEKIDVVGRELKETRKALKALQVHHEKVKEAEFKRALETLRAEKKAALEAGDADALIEIDEKISDAKAEEAAARIKAAEQVNTPHPGFIEWTKRNTWYKQNQELTQVADQVGVAYAAANPDMDPDQVLAYVEKRIRKLYPENFTNPNKSRPSIVEGGTSTPSKKSEPAANDVQLSEDERRVMMTFIRQGILTKEQYLDDIRKVRGQ